jgi:outer membrane protein
MRNAHLVSAIVFSLVVGPGAVPARAQGPSDGDPPRLLIPAPPSGGAAAVRLTLADAIQRGLLTSHRLGELRAREAGAGAVVQASEAARWPEFSLLAGYTRTNHVDPFSVFVQGEGFQTIYPDVPDNLRTRLDMQWPIFTSGGREALIRAARAEYSATGKDLETARADLRLEITRAFWALLTADEAVRVVEGALQRIESYLNDVRNRLKVGLVPPSDELSAQAERSHQQVLLIEARNARESTASDLRRLTGLAPDTAIEVDAALEAPGAPVGAAEEMVAEARRERPDRQAIVQRVAGAGARANAAAAAGKPAIAVAAGVDYARPNPRIFPRVAEWNTSWDVSFNVGWTFWDFGRLKAEVAQATASRLAFSERLQDFDTVLEVEVRQRRLDVEAARAAITAAADGVRSAAEARRVVSDRYAAGVATSTEVMDAQEALLQAELERTRALASARLAEARLERALGR